MAFTMLMQSIVKEDGSNTIWTSDDIMLYVIGHYGSNTVMSCVSLAVVLRFHELKAASGKDAKARK